MQPNNRIDHFLPVRFGNGTLVKQFSKPCIKCQQLLHARHMHGIARVVEDHMALAATAHCPSCHTQFPIACVIDNEKRVRRVVLPNFLFKLYLRSLPANAFEQKAREEGQRQAAREQPAPQAAPAPSVDYPRADAVLGQYQGKPIPAYIVVNGQEVPFDRVDPEGRVVNGEYLLDGCFVYKAA